MSLTTEVSSGTPGPLREPTGIVQRAFKDFANTLDGEETSINPHILRIARRPLSLRQPAVPNQDPEDLGSLLDASPEVEEAVQYFYPITKHGVIDFENQAEASFRVDGRRARFVSLVLQEPTPEGAQLSLRLTGKPGEKAPRRMVEIDGLLGKGIGIAFSIRYDLEKGGLGRRELRRTDGTRKEVGYPEPEIHPNISPKDEAVGKSISIITSDGKMLLLRMPEYLNFTEIIRTAFPPEVFREPFKTTAEQDTTWRDIKWLNGALGMNLTINMQSLPFSL